LSLATLILSIALLKQKSIKLLLSSAFGKKHEPKHILKAEPNLSHSPLWLTRQLISYYSVI
jgi:hypothetical protein